MGKVYETSILENKSCKTIYTLPTYFMLLIIFSFKIRKIKDDVRYFPKGFFPSFFPRIFSKWELPKFAISQAVTSQACPSRKARPPSLF